nr:MAG TPA: helix-turn-helix domain protein [Caudoviricetes sp.]
MYKKFALLLEETNKTIYRVAADTGIATATLYDWRDGRSKPKVDKLAVLAKYFGVSIEYFLE